MPFWRRSTFFYVVCEHLHNLEEGASGLTVFFFRVESLPHTDFTDCFMDLKCISVSNTMQQTSAKLDKSN